MEDKKGLFSQLAEQLDKYNDERFDELKGLLSSVLERMEKVEEKIGSIEEHLGTLDERLEKAEGLLDDLSSRQTAEVEDDSALYEPMTSPEEEEETYRDEEEEYEEDEDTEEVEEVEQEQEQEGDELEDEEEQEEDDEDDEDEDEDDDDEEEEEEEEEEDEADDEAEDDEEPKADDNQPDWYDWEVDYPQEKVEDLVGSMGINDKMQFIGELFDGDTELFNETMQQLENCSNFKEVKNYLMESFGDWDFRSDAVYNFMMHIRRKFN